MDPIDLIIAALITGTAAGTTAGIQSVTAQAIKDVYKSLKEQLQRHFNDHADGGTALAQFDKNPDVWISPTKKLLIETKAIEDPIVMKAAEEILNLAQKDAPQLTQMIIGRVVGQINAPDGKITVVEGNVKKIEM